MAIDSDTHSRSLLAETPKKKFVEHWNQKMRRVYMAAGKDWRQSVD